MKKFLQYSLFWFLSLTWGIIMTLVGLVVAFALLITGHKPYVMGPNIYFKVKYNWGGFSVGPVFVVCKDGGRILKEHECGHSVQNVIFGPLMPFIVAIPSAIRYWYREYLREVKDIKPWNMPAYEDIWFEAQATRFGKKYYSEVK